MAAKKKPMNPTQRTKAATQNLVRSRVVGHEDVDPSVLTTNPLNFRRHGDDQVAALKGALSDLGWVKEAAIVNRATGRIIDGHARVKEALRRKLKSIPVTYVDLSAEEEKLALAVLDPITEMATIDKDTLRQLRDEAAEVAKDPGLRAMLADLVESESASEEGDGQSGEGPPRTEFQILITCKDEQEQADLLLRLTTDGYDCRSLIQ
jgi:hypothetical protein